MSEGNEVNVAKFVIKQTPIGHLKKSLEHLKNLCGEEPLDSDIIRNEIQKYGEDHLNQVPHEDGTIMLVSNLNKDTQDYYWDQSKQIRFKTNEDFTGVKDVETMDFSSNIRNLTEEKLKQYIEKYYRKEVTAINVFSNPGTDALCVMISTHNINEKSCWSGEWLSCWELDNGKVKGNIKANTYYYEEGNVQFNLNRDFNESLTGGDEETLAKNLVDLIEAKETEVELELDKVFENFTKDYIKPLRRQLPVTETKMSWSLNQIAIGSQK